MTQTFVATWWIKAQDRLSSLLGCPPEARSGVVETMMRGGPSESAGYWLQLSLAAGIATMGLVLDSSAVVIGAMLVAPLMGPIVALGMALAIGSPFLVFRSSVRIGLSIALCVAASALIVAALPFHVTTPEIEARTLPTALDLATAGFCALAGVYAAMRPTSDVTSTAAGTSIGISLVPPLCASGYGLGIGNLEIAGGAALLFVTNLVAIAVVATLAFAFFGFTRVDVVHLERDAVSDDGSMSPIPRAARRVALRVGPRGGLGLRLAMPLVLLGAVYFPLRAALDEVAWQIRVRNGLEQALRGLDEEVLESSVRVERNAVDVALVLIGTPADADAVRTELDAEARGATASDTSSRSCITAPPSSRRRERSSNESSPRTWAPRRSSTLARFQSAPSFPRTRQWCSKSSRPLSRWRDRWTSIWLCVEQPPVPTPRRGRATPPDPVRELVLTTIAGFPRLDVVQADAWSLRFAIGSCERRLPPVPTAGGS